MRQMTIARRALLSFACFNVGWWACALGPAKGYVWTGPLALPICVGLPLYFSATRKGEFLFLLWLGAIGFAVDTALIATGIFRVIPDSNFAPAWLVCMWILLGLTFESMLPMRRSIWLVGLMGVMSGPLSYLFAAAVNILAYAEPRWLSTSIHGILWALMMPLLFGIRDQCLRLFIAPPASRPHHWEA